MFHVVFCPSLVHRVFDCYLGQRGLWICHPLKTFGLGLLKDYSATSFQLIRFRKFIIRLEAAWNEMNFSVIQAEFDSMPNRLISDMPSRCAADSGNRYFTIRKSSSANQVHQRGYDHKLQI
ncbi:hypothetical protein TNCV_334001 [Trichonephila clavipes]|nr:hypothetical protein TNCV_334001 [Trichonephila clavipes]